MNCNRTLRKYENQLSTLISCRSTVRLLARLRMLSLLFDLCCLKSILCQLRVRRLICDCRNLLTRSFKSGSFGDGFSSSSGKPMNKNKASPTILFYSQVDQKKALRRRLDNLLSANSDECSSIYRIIPAGKIAKK